MKRKIIAIFVCTLVIAVASLLVAGTATLRKGDTDNPAQLDRSSRTHIAAGDIVDRKEVQPPRILELDFGQKDSLFFQRPFTPTESWIFHNSTYDPSYPVDYTCYENFWDLAGPICDIHWWGLSIDWGLMANCDPAGMEFEIKIYSDDPTDHLNMPPTDVVCTYTQVLPTYTYYDNYGGWDCYYFSFDLDPCCDVRDGWVSIRSTYSPNNCWFFWSGSPEGDAFAYQENGDPMTNDLALVLTGPPEETLWYWKPDTTNAPSGMPDFDQYQFGPPDSLGMCGPTAVANCLWWFNAVPGGTTPDDLIRLLSDYFNTDPEYGTYVDSIQLGLDRYFQDYGFALQEITYWMPDFYEMEDSLKVCQDIILLIGFWWSEDGYEWYREGGHFVTMAGVCSESLKIAISDPARDMAVGGWPGRVRPPTHPPAGTYPPTLHNNPLYVSHDMYQSILDPPFPSPGNPHWEIDYPWYRSKHADMNIPERFRAVTKPVPKDGQYFFATEVEAAIMICPKEEEEWPNHKMHYPQLPDPEGWDVVATMGYGSHPGIVVADDFMCTKTLPITDIHFWGSWLWDQEVPIFGFWLSIHSNIPSPPAPWSMPGEELWSAYITDYEMVMEGEGPQGWYDPFEGWWEHPNHMMYYRYDITDIPNPFCQDSGTIYWLNVMADIGPIGYQGFPEPPLWGWKTSLDHFMDDATWSWFIPPDYPAGWIPLYDPITGMTLDMAFVITGEKGLCGDVTGDGIVDLGDVLFIISYLYKGGVAPCPLSVADVDCSGIVDLGDVLYLISYLYKGGTPPCDPDGDGIPDC